MTHFLALVHKDPDSAFGLSFPDLPGCFSAADDGGDIVANAREALDLWFESEPWTAPRDLEAVRTEVAEDLREGAFLMAIPYQPRTAERAA